MASACALLVVSLLLGASCDDIQLPLVLSADSGPPDGAAASAAGVQGVSVSDDTPDLPACDVPPDGFSHNTPPIVHGCHPDVFLPEECKFDFRLPPCVPPRDGEAVSVWEAEDLPCGSCSDSGYRCALLIHPLCDCDGEGPRLPFVEPNPDYSDGWQCLCLGGTWKCMVEGVTGDDCSVCRTDASL